MPLLPGYTIVTDDGRNISKNQLIPKQVDVVITRHPQITTKSNDPWSTIYKRAATKLRSGGLLVATCFDKNEFLLTKEAISNSGLKIEVKEENPRLEGDKVTDNWIILATK